MIDRFLTYIRCELNYSAHTVDAYKSDLNLLADFLTAGQREQFRPDTVTLNDLRAWISHQATSDLSARTLRRRTLAARTLFQYLRRQGLIEQNPAADLPLPRLPRRLPTFVREQEMEKIIEPGEFDTGDFEQLRDKLIIELLYTTGMRRAELLGLRQRDVNTSSGELKVTGKRNKQRLIPLAPQVCVHIEQYRRLCISAGIDTEADEPFILTSSGAPLNNHALSRIVKIQLAPTSSSRKTPHVLRHSFATAMLRHNARLDSVKELLGHSSLATTQVYTHLSFSELQQNYKQAHPRATKPNDHGSKD